VIACCGWIGGGALDCPDSETASDVRTLFEKALTSELFQVLSEAPIVDGFVPFNIIVGAVLFYSGM